MITEKKDIGLLPIVKRMSDAHVMLCASEGVSIKDYCGYRSFEEQANLYNQGRTKKGRIVTNAAPGKSFHQYRVAKDTVPIVNGKAIWNDNSLWELIAIKGKAVGFEWGGDWKRFKDRVHFQFTGGLSTTEMAKLTKNEMNAYLEGWMVGMGLMKTLEIAEKEL